MQTGIEQGRREGIQEGIRRAQSFSGDAFAASSSEKGKTTVNDNCAEIHQPSKP